MGADELVVVAEAAEAAEVVESVDLDSNLDASEPTLLAELVEPVDEEIDLLVLEEDEIEASGFTTVTERVCGVDFGVSAVAGLRVN